jgi:hypothetical protein
MQLDLGEHLAQVVDHRAEERPASVHVAQAREAALALRFDRQRRLQTAARSVPAL